MPCSPFAQLTLIACFLSFHFSSVLKAEEPDSQQISAAMEQAFQILKKGVRSYPEHRSCFSCHHQTLPMMAMSIPHRTGPTVELGGFLTDELTTSVLEFTESSFEPKKESMREGTGVGGRALTVAYGLWGLDIAGAKANETTDAMVDYLLKTQADDGAWEFQSHRPPAASSRTMTTAISVFGLRAYGKHMDQDPRVRTAFGRVLKYLVSIESPADQEDLVGAVWLAHLLETEFNDAEQSRQKEISSTDPSFAADLKTIAGKATQWRERLRQSQKPDGGWSQTEDLPSDAYATGQALLILSQTGSSDGIANQDATVRERGVKYLLGTQQKDGSWHVSSRSKPVQVFFDNGDPHGADQFISMMATSWASAALADFRFPGTGPLDSFQERNRRAFR